MLPNPDSHNEREFPVDPPGRANEIVAFEFVRVLVVERGASPVGFDSSLFHLHHTSHTFTHAVMDLFNRDELRRLAQVEDATCISLYMPTIRFESDWSQNTTRFKNLITEARNQLREQDVREDKIDEILAEARRILDDTSFWRSVSDGLAVFITSDSTETFRLPLSFSEIAVVGTSFHLKPLFPIIATNNRFYLLTLSQNDVRLYQGTHQAISEVESEDIPTNIVDAIRQYEDPEKQLQMHTSNRAQGTETRTDAEFHGQGGGNPDDLSGEPQDELKRFFRSIDESVRTHLRDEKAPLVLAGVREYLPLYVDVNEYPNLIETDIAAGNPEPLNAKELHNKAWEIVEPVFMEAQTEALESFQQLYYQDGALASDDFHEIIPACAYSRVNTLFVPIDQHRWGHFDASDNTVELHDDQRSGDEDLLNYAAVHAHLNGATVYALRPDTMPDGRMVAATFRYEADVSATESG